MSEKAEITFMQTRLIRLASEEWHLSIEQIIDLFKKVDVLGYIERGYGIFHCEGDEAVFEDIVEFLDGKGIKIHAFGAMDHHIWLNYIWKNERISGMRKSRINRYLED